MAMVNPNFIVEQRAIYDGIHAQASVRQEADTVEVRLQASAEENTTNCASYVPTTNHQAA